MCMVLGVGGDEEDEEEWDVVDNDVIMRHRLLSIISINEC
jgi:hypothetical protein